jgi:hypothetical protein
MEPADLPAGDAITRIPVSAGRPIGHVERKFYRCFIEHLGRYIHGGIHDEGPRPNGETLWCRTSDGSLEERYPFPAALAPDSEPPRSLPLIRSLTATRSCCTYRQHSTSPWTHLPQAMSQRSQN